MNTKQTPEIIWIDSPYHQMDKRIAHAAGITNEVQAIINHCIHTHGVTLAQLKGPSRKRTLVVMRQECMYEIYRRTAMSMERIGQIFNRDHTTVCYAIKCCKERELVVANRVPVR